MKIKIEKQQIEQKILSCLVSSFLFVGFLSPLFAKDKDCTQQISDAIWSASRQFARPVASYFFNEGVWPATNAQVGLLAPQTYQNKSFEYAAVGVGGTIIIGYRSAVCTAEDKYSIVLQGRWTNDSQIEWYCSSNLPIHLRPAICKEEHTLYMIMAH